MAKIRLTDESARIRLPLFHFSGKFSCQYLAAAAAATATQLSLTAHQSPSSLLAGYPCAASFSQVDSPTAAVLPRSPSRTHAQTLALPCRPAPTTKQNALAWLLLLLPYLLCQVWPSSSVVRSGDMEADLLLVNDEGRPATCRHSPLLRPPRATWPPWLGMDSLTWTRSSGRASIRRAREMEALIHGSDLSASSSPAFAVSSPCEPLSLSRPKNARFQAAMCNI
jgi:hypothetical protein